MARSILALRHSRFLLTGIAGMHSNQGHRPHSPAHSVASREPEIEADLKLDSDIVPKADAVGMGNGPAEVFLLTGTTGFLGAYLLRDLLVHTRAQVICLVRAATVSEGRARIEDNLRAYGLDLNPAQLARLEALPGDLAHKHLGLDPKIYSALADRVQAILHGAATVNFYQTYHQLRATNVGGVREILRFAVQGRRKAVHYISSTGVFDSDACRGLVMRETDAPAHCDGSVMGYTQTKWVAEQLMFTARERGVPVSIYRPPFIMGDSRTGVVDAENIIVKMLIGSLQGGFWPEDQIDVEMVPVDALSRAIVHLTSAGPGCKTYHISSPQPMRWGDLGLAARAYGYTVALGPYDQWKRKLAEFGRRKNNALRPLVRFYTKTPPRLSAPAPEVFTRPPRPIFDSTATQAILAPAGLVPPRMTHALFAIYLDYFVRQGWLETPSALKAALPVSGRNGSRPPQAAFGTHA